MAALSEEEIRSLLDRASASRQLQLMNRLIPRLPPQLLEVPGLQAISLVGTGLTEVPDVFSPDSCRSLTSVTLSSNSLRSLPSSLHHATTSLTRLSVMRNQLSVFPEVICALTGLTELHVQANRIDELPDAISNLRSLRRLVLDSNELDDLPSTLPLLPLRKLSLNYNRFRAVPECLSRMTLLEELNLGHCRIDEFPMSLARCSALRIVLLSANRIRRLPDDLDRLSSLRALVLDWNLIEELPAAILRMPRLATLSMEGNPLKRPPLAIFVEHGPQGAFQWSANAATGMEAQRVRDVTKQFIQVLQVIAEQGWMSSAVFTPEFLMKFDENEAYYYAFVWDALFSQGVWDRARQHWQHESLPVLGEVRHESVSAGSPEASDDESRSPIQRQTLVTDQRSDELAKPARQRRSSIVQADLDNRRPARRASIIDELFKPVRQRRASIIQADLDNQPPLQARQRRASIDDGRASTIPRQGSRPDSTRARSPLAGLLRPESRMTEMSSILSSSLRSHTEDEPDSSSFWSMRPDDLRAILLQSHDQSGPVFRENVFAMFARCTCLDIDGRPAPCTVDTPPFRCMRRCCVIKSRIVTRRDLADRELDEHTKTMIAAAQDEAVQRATAYCRSRAGQANFRGTALEQAHQDMIEEHRMAFHVAVEQSYASRVQAVRQKFAVRREQLQRAQEEQIRDLRAAETRLESRIIELINEEKTFALQSTLTPTAFLLQQAVSRVGIDGRPTVPADARASARVTPLPATRPLRDPRTERHQREAELDALRLDIEAELLSPAMANLEKLEQTALDKLTIAIRADQARFRPPPAWRVAWRRIKSPEYRAEIRRTTNLLEAAYIERERRLAAERAQRKYQAIRETLAVWQSSTRKRVFDAWKSLLARRAGP